MKYLRNNRHANRSDFSSAEHQERAFDVPGYISHVDPEMDTSTPPANPSAAYVNKHPDEARVQGLLNAIENDCFKYYVKGGFIRSRNTFVTPMQVARLHNLPIEKCLFEIKDDRIKAAILRKGIEVFSGSTHRPNKQGFNNRSYNMAAV